ncbi:hypothetical protein SOVF_039750 [Spinacia oleracea]|uniref:Chromatin-remodeling ATPase INO80 n=1 Tax=Spinacia oleracea TaxID=3562 RepID=A0A9R0I2M6_SPIOL|nr:chromatin-remodeling ATPase INO80-like [Spinacia oleracea]KNA21802.1 hypothetical protein SOVF_039750 [Spinacia oleracea]
MAIGSLRHQQPKGIFKMTYFRVVYRSVLNHPFLMVMLLFLVCLHRYFPFLFSLLVSASPVIICTAILLGTLLIYGEPNDNNNKNHEEMSNTHVTLRNGVDDHAYSVDKEEIFSKDRFSEVRKDIVEKGMRGSGMLSSGISVNEELTNEIGWDYCNGKRSKGSLNYKEKSKSSFGFANFEMADVQMHRDREFDDNSIKLHRDIGKQDRNADYTVNHVFSDTESDEKEKSAFDALVADIIPTIQETHPLLDSEDPSHPDTSNASLKFELQSLDSNHSSADSSDDENGDETDNINENETLKAEMEKSQQLESLFTRTIDEVDEEEEMVDDENSSEDVEADDDDDEDDDDEEENSNVEKGVSKQVTIWTEEDEKNLRLVGNSELERDLRLENLLARRRVKRNFSMISERNLIDLDRPDIPFQIPPISTTRVNPFDTPSVNNTYQHQFNLPPIPGSAPSVRVPRRNPFESPCTSPKAVQNLTEELRKEETMEMNLNNAVFQETRSLRTGYNHTGNSLKPNLNNAGFHETGSSSTGYNHVLKPDFVEINRKDAVFRRYESFSTGYNHTGEASRKDFMEIDRRDAVLRRHETFNTRSAFRNVFTPSQEKFVHFKVRPVFVVPEQVVGGDQEVRHDSESSHESESNTSSSDSDHNEPKQDLVADESDHVSNHSEETSSESSDMVDSLHDDQEEELVDSLEANAEVNADHIFHKEEAVHENVDDDATSSTSTSMASEKDHSSERMGQDEEDEAVNKSVFSPKASSTMSDLNPGSMEEEHGIIEPPVYDSSPSSAGKVTPFSFSDGQV